MTPEGETARLLLRPLALADAAQFQQLFPRWEVVRYLLDIVPWPYPADGALRFIRDAALPAVARGDAWHWTLRLKNQPEQIIGHLDLRRGREDNRGFWIGLPWQNRGLMSEACLWSNDFWFDELGF
jgi:RimJ/RimL family protein N-acetyltransferase